MKKQCELLGISRTAYYYHPRNEREDKDITDLKLILKVLQKIPFYGYRKVSMKLIKEHPDMSVKRVRRIMRRFGIRAIYAKPWLSKASKEHKKYPYLLKGKVIRYPNQA